MGFFYVRVHLSGATAVMSSPLSTSNIIPFLFAPFFCQLITDRERFQLALQIKLISAGTSDSLVVLDGNA